MRTRKEILIGIGSWTSPEDIARLSFEVLLDIRDQLNDLKGDKSE